MAEDGGQKPDRLTPFLAGSTRLSQIIQALLALAGLLVALKKEYRENTFLLKIAFLALLLSATWYAAAYWWRHQRRKTISIAPPARSPSAYLRGLLPFERGEELLGRDQDVIRVLTIIRGLDFRLGFITGEAGAGKTSLLRAGVLPKAEEIGTKAVYVPRTGNNPSASLANVLRLSLPPVASLEAILSAYLQGHAEASVLVIWDQFEEFFVANRTKATREPFFREVAAALGAENDPGGARLMFSLRKEFVDDLLDLADLLPGLIDLRRRYPLRNWDPGTALGVLDAAAQHDQIPFAEALKQTLVADLAQSGVIRPVELQLVATHLADQAIYERPQYEEAGRARGVIAAFVKDIIAPVGDRTKEIDRQITKHLLLLLCAEKGDTRRPVGLTLPELTERIEQQIRGSGGDQLLLDTTKLPDGVASNLGRCVQAFLVIQEDEERYNLAHDYIVPAVRDATADLDSVEDRANRLLDQYKATARLGPRFVIPYRHYRYIQRYSTADRRQEPEAALLIARSKKSYVRKGLVYGFAGLAMMSLIWPPHVGFSVTEVSTAPSEWTVKAGTVAVSAVPGKGVVVWRLGEPWSKRIESSVPFARFVVSDRGSYLAGISAAGELHVWRTDKAIVPGAGKVLTGLTWSADPRLDSHKIVSFSPDESSMYAVLRNGDIFLWNPASGLDVGQQPLLHGSSDDLPGIIFSPDSRWVALGIGVFSGQIFVLPAATPPAAAPTPVAHFSTRLDKDFVIFSGDGKWIAWTSAGRMDLSKYRLGLFNDDAVTAWRLGSTTKLTLQAPTHFAASDAMFRLEFSPDSRWLVGRRAFMPFITWDLTNRVSHVGVISAGEWMENGSDVRPEIWFSPNGEWAAGTADDQKLYLWRLTKAGPKNQPVFPGSYSLEARPFVAFSPDTSRVAAVAPDGSVHVWSPGKSADLVHPVARQDTRGVVRFSEDGAFLYTCDESKIYFGRSDHPLSLVTTSSSEVQALAQSPDHRKLFVFAKEKVLTARRRLYFWGLPVWTFDWPAMKEAIVLERRQEE